MFNRFVLFQTNPGGNDGGGAGGSQDSQEDTENGGTSQEDSGGTQGGTTSTRMIPATEAEEARREAKNLRTRLRETEARLKSLEDAGKSDTEKLVGERDQMKIDVENLRTENRRMRAELLGARVGIAADARQDAARLLDWDSISDPEDTKQVERALRDLVKEKPYLLGTGSSGGADGGAGNSGAIDNTDMNVLMRRAAGRA